MATEPDFAKLRNGVLYFPPGSPPSELHFATAATWADWSGVGKAEIWKLVALSVHLEPQVLAWQNMPHPPLRSVGDNSYAAVTQIYEKTISGLFLKRLREATNDILCLSLTLRAFGSIAKPVEETVVRVLDFVRWAEGELIKLPALFPTGDGPSDAPSSARPRRGHISQAEATPADGLIRLPEVLALVGFSGATLWRRVKDQQFPQPTRPSPRVTAWVRSDIDKWLKEQSSPVTPQSAKRSRRKA